MMKKSNAKSDLLKKKKRFFFVKLQLFHGKIKITLIILYTTCSLRPENTIHTDQQTKTKRIPCVYYNILHYLLKRKCILQYTTQEKNAKKSYLTSHRVLIIGGHYFTKKKLLLCWLVFKNTYYGRRCSSVQFFLFSKKKKL